MSSNSSEADDDRDMCGQQKSYGFSESHPIFVAQVGLFANITSNHTFKNFQLAAGLRTLPGHDTLVLGI
jgi:hypothetical protein